jgi:hypothetical protein
MTIRASPIRRVQVLGEEYIKKNILPYTRLGRLIEPSEIAEAQYAEASRFAYL